MKLSVDEFTHWEHKSITLLGMSGVGKTFLSNILRSSDWFHYSGDYRIGTHYLNEPILDNIKHQAMAVPFLRTLLLSDSIYIRNNISVDNLAVVSAFLGKLGNTKEGGLSLVEFKRRQQLHVNAEINAMLDVPNFIHKANVIYGYQYFLNDAGGSVCELDSPNALETLAKHSLILYLKIPPTLEKTIIQRAKSDPKPLYYREAFLDAHLEEFMTLKGLTHSNQISPNEFVTWVFPCLFKARLPRYEAIADQYGYTLMADKVMSVRDEQDFIQLICQTLSQSSSLSSCL
jgi:hypothetical protein